MLGLWLQRALLFSATLAALPAVAGGELIGPPPQEYKTEITGEIGLNISTGNSPNREIRLAGSYEQEDELRRYEHKALFYREQAASAGEPMVVSEEKAYWKSRGEWYFVDQPGYLFAKLAFEYDRFSYLKQSSTATGGFGYSVVRSKPLRFDLEAGLGWQHAHRLDDSQYQTVVSVLAENLRWQINDQWELRQDASSYRTRYERNLELNAELRRRFTQNLSLKLGLEWQHLSPVPEGVAKNDTVTMLSLIYSM